MSQIRKKLKKDPKKKKRKIGTKKATLDQKQEELKENDLEVLTPWQKENLRYTKEKGGQPAWTPSVIQYEKKNGSETGTIPKESTSKSIEKVHLQEVRQEYSFTDKLPNLKKERRKRMKRRLIVLVSFFSIIFLAMIYFISPYSKVGEIKVAGNQRVAKDQIILSSKLSSSGNLWQEYFNRDQAVERLKKANPRIKKATIQLQLLNNLVIRISEYKTVAYSVENGKYFSILENGNILEKEEAQPNGTNPILENFKDQKIIQLMLKEYKKLPDEIKSNISEIQSTPSTSNSKKITVFMNDGNRVIASITGFSQKMSYYSNVAAQMSEKGVIDMEAGIFSYPYTSESQNIETEEKNNE